MVSELSDIGSETYLVITYTKLSFCLTFSLIWTRATPLDFQLLGTDMRRNKVNKWAWYQRFRFSTTLCVPLCDVSAVYDGVSAYRTLHVIGLSFRRRVFPVCHLHAPRIDWEKRRRSIKIHEHNEKTQWKKDWNAQKKILRTSWRTDWWFNRLLSHSPRRPIRRERADLLFSSLMLLHQLSRQKMTLVKFCWYFCFYSRYYLPFICHSNAQILQIVWSFTWSLVFSDTF